MRRTWLLAMLLLTVAVLGGCAGGEAPSPVAVATGVPLDDGASLPPTWTPKPPTPTRTPAPTREASGNFGVSAGGRGNWRTLEPGAAPITASFDRPAQQGFSFVAASDAPLLLVVEARGEVNPQVDLFQERLTSAPPVGTLPDAQGDGGRLGRSEALLIRPAAGDEFSVVVRDPFALGGNYTIRLLNVAEGAEGILHRAEGAIPMGQQVESRVALPAGPLLRVLLLGENVPDASAPDLQLTLLGPDGQPLGQWNESGSNGLELATFRVPADGDYTFRVENVVDGEANFLLLMLIAAP